MSSSIGVVILNYHSHEDTISLYKAIGGFLNEQIKVIVIDNSCSKEEERNLRLAISSNDLIINKENNGYAGGNNIGISLLLGFPHIHYIVILNPDIRLDPTIFGRLVRHFESDPLLAAVGPRLCFRDMPLVIYSDGGILKQNEFLIPTHLNMRKQLLEENDEKTNDMIDYINGSFLVISRRAIEELGTLPEHYFLYFEETDWCYNAKLKGWNLLVDTSEVAYQRSSNKGPAYHYYFTRNLILFNCRYNKNSNIDAFIKQRYLEAFQKLLSWRLFKSPISTIKIMLMTFSGISDARRIIRTGGDK